MNNGARLLTEAALASRSPRRKQLLESLGLRVAVIGNAFEELPYRPGDGEPRDYALAAARSKAAAAPNEGPPVLVAADTCVVVDGAVLGKPRDAAEAERMLHVLAGREHVVHTGFALIDRTSRATASGVESARVTFEPLDDDAIARYVASGEPLDKAGAYGIQGLGALLVASIVGDFYAVMGLPIARIGQALTRFGYRLF